MLQIVRFFIASPLLYLVHKIVTKCAVVISAILVMIILIFSKSYLFPSSNSKSVNLLNQHFDNKLTETSSTKEIVVKKGDTFEGILRSQNLASKDFRELNRLAKLEKTITNLRIGQIFTFYYTVSDEQSTLSKLTLQIDRLQSTDFLRQNDQFIVKHNSVKLNKLITKHKTTIQSNLITSLVQSGIKTNHAVELSNAYSHQIDFQRQIKVGDNITVVAEKFMTEDGDFSHFGKILYASLSTGKKEYNIYSYSPNSKDSNTQFFAENGHMITKETLQTPVKGARISSHFGYRKKHPVLGYGKMHKGVDYAVPTGTPIYAASTGTVDFIGWKSGYGRFVVLKHDSNLSTAYAHASKFATNIKRGSKVKKGQIIAYVGTSGHATGPHLHYEVRVKGKHVNPLRFKSKIGTNLTGTRLAQFNQHKEQLKNVSKKLDKNIKIASIN